MNVLGVFFAVVILFAVAIRAVLKEDISHEAYETDKLQRLGRGLNVTDQITLLRGSRY